MPTYDYLCEKCGHTFEKMQAMSAKVLRKCPKCKKLKLKRLIGGGTGIIVTGQTPPPDNRIKGRPEHIKF